ncbi:MAG: M20/M25/M40 family metallo-hydrolase [Caldilineaceae bacterium]
MHTDRLISFTQALVQRPSLSGEEAQVAARVEEEMRALGFDAVDTDAYGNVIGVVNGAQPGKTLLFDAHTDTVGISPGVPWDRDPFSGAVADGAIHGRGAADMKGALAAMVHAAAAVDRSALRGRVVVSASTLEEVLEGVALEQVMERYPPDFVVIGEASNLTLVRGGRGRAEIHLETVGRPSHSSAPQQGRNAVLDMMRVIAVVEALPLPDHPRMGPAINALTDIISDPYPGHSVIPSICRATYDRRLLPGETIDDVLAPIAGAPEIADIRLNATIGTGEYAAFTGHLFVKEKFFPAWLPGGLTRSCRRRSTPWPGRISPPRPQPTASAPTPPTARAWPACPPSATAPPPKPTPRHQRAAADRRSGRGGERVSGRLLRAVLGE